MAVRKCYGAEPKNIYAIVFSEALVMLGERFKLNGNCFLALLFFASLALGDETRIVLLVPVLYKA